MSESQGKFFSQKISKNFKYKKIWFFRVFMFYVRFKKNN
jgi:hypothetical protein